VFETAINRKFSNIGFAGGGRAFPGFPRKSEALRKRLAPREAFCCDLKAGDIVSIVPSTPGQPVHLLVFSSKGRLEPGLLGLQDGPEIAASDFSSGPLLAWIAGNGGAEDTALHAAEVRLDEMAVLQASGPCTLWAIRPQTAAGLVETASEGTIDLAVKPASQGAIPVLPPALGEIRDEFTVQRGSAQAYELRPGEIVQIIDVEGQQCSDFLAMRQDLLEAGIERTIDSTATRTMVRSAYPAPGLFDKFYDRELRPMMRVLQDTCGRHDTFGMACTARGYEDRGFPGHLNCSDNISRALEPFGVGSRPAWPAINFFWNTWADEQSHHILTEESYSRPGDYVALQALDHLVCATTACPDDLDPINGWNPTDVHVRIYRPDAPIRRAVAHREKEDAPMSMSQESAFHPATSKLTTHFATARDVWAPVSFPSVGTVGEYWACRNQVTLQDMSSLRKYDIIGPDAERLLQQVMTRDVARLAVWRGTYALICDEAGTVVDDGTLFRIGHDLFRWCCGSEESARVFEAAAEDAGLQVRIHALDGALPNLALQGPRSRDLLRKIVFTQPSHPALDHLKWFGVTVARLNNRDGIPFMLARSGYTGELGYELFCAASDGPALWDAVMAAGDEFGIAPMGSAALETIRIEAGLAARAEFAPGVDAFEAGLGFAVSLGKTQFTGKAALERNARDPRRALKGLKFQCNDVPAHGAHVYSGERPVGVITSAARSPMFECTIAMARLAVEYAGDGTELEVGQMDGRMKRLPATVCSIPFFDPKRERARA
jgi:aminomethyltransferase